MKKFIWCLISFSWAALNQDSKSIAQGMAESKQKAARAMDAANSELWLGVVSGAGAAGPAVSGPKSSTTQNGVQSSVQPSMHLPAGSSSGKPLDERTRDPAPARQAAQGSISRLHEQLTEFSQGAPW